MGRRGEMSVPLLPPLVWKGVGGENGFQTRHREGYLEETPTELSPVVKACSQLKVTLRERAC